MGKKVSLEKTKMGVIGYLLVAFVVLFAVFPIYWLLITSFKPKMEWIANPPIWFPRRPILVNYEIIFFETATTAEYVLGSFLWFKPATDAFINSAIVAGFGTILAVVVGTLAALGVSRHGIGGNTFMGLVLMLRMAPPMVAIIPLALFYSVLGFADTHHGLILAYATFTMPYVVWIIKSFIDEVPKELEESARLDGLSPLAAHFKVTLPLIKGGILATSLFVWILNWSEYLFAVMLTHGNVVTLPVQITKYQTFMGTLYGPQAALAILAVIPLVVFGIIIRKHLARGLTFGAIKG